MNGNLGHITKLTLLNDDTMIHLLLLKLIPVKASSHIGDTTRHDSMRHDPFFRSLYNQMDQFTHMQHDNVLSSRQKAAAPKIALEAIFVVCRSDSIKKTAKENSFHRNLTWVYKFMTQEYSLTSQYLQLNLIQVVVL